MRLDIGFSHFMAGMFTHLLVVMLHCVTNISELPAIESLSLFIDGIETNQSQGGNVVVNGSEITITCNAFGIPEPELMWEKDGELPSGAFVTNISSQVYYTAKSLTIVAAVPEDSGNYSCVAMNRGGIARASTLLQVLGSFTIV